MARHSKWANIKHKKERADAKKGKVFTRVSKEIINAVKLGGPDAKANPRLRLALQKAKAANVPNDNVERCIKRASSADQASYIDAQYELYGYGGVGILVEALTDNKNRMASEIRIATNKRGGTIAEPGSVAFNFDKKGVIHIAKEKAFEDDLFMMASDAGAQDFITEENAYVVFTDPVELDTVKEAINKSGIEVCDSELDMLPKCFIECDDEAYQKNLALIEWLEEIDDVDQVFHNMQMREG